MDELGMRMVAMAVREKEAHSLKKVGECYRNISKNNENYLTSVQMYYSNVEHFQDKVLADTLGNFLLLFSSNCLLLNPIFFKQMGLLRLYILWICWQGI